MKAREFWCWLTTGHDLIAHYVKERPDIRYSVLVCQDCGARFRSRKVNWLTETLDADSERLSRKLAQDHFQPSEILPEGVFPPNAGAVRNEFAELKQRYYKEDLEVVVLPDVGIGFNHPNKAHAAKRKRGPGGQFLPNRPFTARELEEARLHIQAAISKRKRGKNGRFVKGKKK